MEVNRSRVVVKQVKRKALERVMRRMQYSRKAASGASAARAVDIERMKTKVLAKAITDVIVGPGDLFASPRIKISLPKTSVADDWKAVGNYLRSAIAKGVPDAER